MAKSNILFRQVSDVAEELDTPQHTLRYWETQFKEVVLLRRAGNRRHYRSEDVNLLAGIKKLVHEDGLTLKAVKRIFSEEGADHIRDIGSKYLDDSKTRGEEEAVPPIQNSGSTEIVARGNAKETIQEAVDALSSNDAIRDGAVDGPEASRSIDSNALRSILERLKNLRNRMAAETP